MVEKLKNGLFEKIACIMMCIWGAWPVYSIFMFLFWEYGKDDGGMIYYAGIAFNRYKDIFLLLGQLTELIVVVYLIFSIVKNRKELWERFKNSPWNWALLGMLLWSVIATVFSVDRENSMVGSDYRYEGLPTYFIYAAIFILGQLLRDEKLKKIVFRIFSGAGSIVSIVLILQDAGVPFFAKYFIFPRSACFRQFNHLGYYLCMTIMGLIGLYIFEKKILWKIVYALMLFLQMYALFVNSTLGAYLGVLFGFFALILFVCIGYRYREDAKKLRLALIVPAAIIIITTFMSYMEWIPTSSGETMRVNVAEMLGDTQNIAAGEGEMAGHGRVFFWKVGLEILAEKPILGFGPENMDWEIAGKMWEGRDRIANEVLQYAIYIGIPGALMYLAALVLMLFSRIKNIKKITPYVLAAAGIALAYFFSSMLGNSMFYTAPFYWMFLGMAATSYINNQKD